MSMKTEIAEAKHIKLNLFFFFFANEFNLADLFGNLKNNLSAYEIFAQVFPTLPWQNYHISWRQVSSFGEV